MDAYETILTETRGRVGLITLNRPKALNALNFQVMREVVAAAGAFDADPGIGCIVLTGSAKAFAAGADVKEMQSRSFDEMFRMDAYGGWEALTRVRTPLIAAVAGFALGGGCELAQMCDLIIAAESAKFGQPEIRLGIMPGMGGSQRLTRAIGKAKAMELCLTGRMMGAAEAERAGLVARVVADDALLDEAMKMAEAIAAMPLTQAMMVKEAVNRAFETTLAEGLLFERRMFHATFAAEDNAEGLAAFVEKRPARFRGE